MENKTSLDHVTLEETDCEQLGAGQQTNSNALHPHYQQNPTDDILLEDFAQEECFILNEEFVLMEEEYVMWEGTVACKKKHKAETFMDVFDAVALSLPDEDSLHHAGKYFTLKTENRAQRQH